MKNICRVITALVLSLAFSLSGFSQSSRGRLKRKPQTPPTATPSRLKSRPITPITVTVYPEGTFFPSTIRIKPGDTVRWVGLKPTDAIVQIENPDSAPSADVCGISGNRLDHRFDGSDENEFTGPTRVAVSGIFALGPDDFGYSKVAATDTCSCQPNCKPTPTIVGVEQICPDQGLRTEVLPETWDNPDITGVIIRLNWSDLQQDIGGQIKNVWDDLDRQMDRAVEHGKLFTLDVRAGMTGTPPWIFSNYTGPAGPGPVAPLFFKDWADGDVPPIENCGFRMTLGSPTHTTYLNLYVAMIEALAKHVASDSRWFQAVAHVKASGANYITSEARMPKRCFDSETDGDKKLDIVTWTNASGVVKKDDCICNTQRWADASYTPEGLFKYYRVVENAIFKSFFGRKSIGYQLIQDGFPRVESVHNFMGDTLKDQSGNPLRVPAGTTDDDPVFDLQTRTVMKQGREGRFVDPFSSKGDRAAGFLFVPQHSGLQILPDDRPTHLQCVQHQAVEQTFVVLPGGLISTSYRAHFPSIFTGSIPNTGVEGCPNPWAVREGFDDEKKQKQIMGFQTTNAHATGGPVASPEDVESALWNLTINSNGVFIELYEERLWEIFKTRSSSERLSADGRVGKMTAPHSKTLHAWLTELHDRRRQLVTADLPDPFPIIYEHTFSKTLLGPETYYYINPSKCAMAHNPEARVGKIIVSPFSVSPR